MKTKIIIAIIISLLILSVFLTADSLLNTTKKIPIEKLNELKNSVKLKAGDSLNIQYGKIICDDSECWSSVYYPNLIQTEWRGSRKYCSKYIDVITHEIDYCVNEAIYANETVQCYEKEIKTKACSKYSDYTIDELININFFIFHCITFPQSLHTILG